MHMSEKRGCKHIQSESAVTAAVLGVCKASKHLYDDLKVSAWLARLAPPAALSAGGAGCSTLVTVLFAMRCCRSAMLAFSLSGATPLQHQQNIVDQQKLAQGYIG